MLIIRNRNYRLLFTAAAVSNLGDGISALAFPWLAALLTRDPLLIAAVAAASKLPWLLFSAPAGVITDRYDRQRLMVCADVIRFGLTFAVICLILLVPALEPAPQNTRYVGALAVLAFGLGMAEVLRDNAAQTALPSVVEPSQLERANGQIWSVEQIMGAFIGPPLAGALIALAVPMPFLVDALSFALAAVLVACISFPARTAPVERHSFWSEMKEGARWLLAHRTVLQLAVLLGFVNAFHAGYATLHVLVAQEILGLGAVGFGLLMMAAAAGGVLGGIFGPQVVERYGPQRVFLAAICCFAIEPLIFSFSSSAYVIAVAMAATMAAAVTYNVVTVSYRQRRIPDAILGRVNALYRLLGWGAMPVGIMLAGFAVSTLEGVIDRQAALRVPFGYAAAGYILLLIYAANRISLDD